MLGYSGIVEKVDMLIWHSANTAMFRKVAIVKWLPITLLA